MAFGSALNYNVPDGDEESTSDGGNGDALRFVAAEAGELLARLPAPSLCVPDSILNLSGDSGLVILLTTEFAVMN